jgi:hypothetical protein
MPNNTSEAHITPPNYTLRKKIGEHVVLSQIFTPEKINQCQQMADEMLAGFREELETQLVELGNVYMKAMHDPAPVTSAMQEGKQLSFLLKKSMENLNYKLGYQVAKSLCDYTQGRTNCNAEVFLVICKHIAVLNIILKDGIKGDGGAMGQELMVNLQSLIQKAEE